MPRPPDPRPPDPSRPTAPWRRDLALAGVVAALVALSVLLGLLLDGRDGALQGATLALAACVLGFTVTTVLWTTGAARRFRDGSRRR